MKTIIVIMFLLFTSLFINNAKAQISNTEFKALSILYKSTSGRNWNNHTNWDFSKPASAVNSNWSGLTVKDGHIIKISLSGNNLIGFIPKEIEHFKYLIKLNLSNNELFGGFPKVIGNLKKLKTLQLQNNQLSGSIPPEIGNLNNIEKLNLSNNEFTCGIPSEIGRLKKLIELQLFDIPFGGTIPKEIGELENLEVLYLCHCKLNGKIPVEIDNLKNLKRLWLCDNRLIGTIPKGIGEMTKLTELELKGNQLSGNIIHLSKLNNLLFLMIQNNKFTFEYLEKAVPYIKTSNQENNFHYSDQAKINISKIYKESKIVLDAHIQGNKNTYQWYKNGKLIEGAVSTKYIINNSVNEAGTYVCKVKNSLVPKLILETNEITIK